MTLDQGKDTPLSHGQYSCEVSFKSKLPVKSYGPNTDFGYLCTVNLTFEIQPCVKVVLFLDQLSEI